MSTKLPTVFIAQLTTEQLHAAVKLRARELHELMPETLTHIVNVGKDQLRIGFQFKLLGLDWRSDIEYMKIFEAMRQTGILLFNGHQMQRNPNYNFES